MVHYLMFADQGAHRSALDRFTALTLEGKTSAAATEIAFGNPQALENGFSQYINRQVLTFMHFDVDVSVKPERFSPRALSVAEAAVAQAAFHTAMRRPAEARALMEQARKADPRLAACYEVDGLLLESERKAEDARAAYAKAIELGSTSFYPYYRWAALTPLGETGDSTIAGRMDDALKQATTLNERFAPAYGLLGEVRLRLGRREEALTLAQRGVSLAPGQVQNRLALARVLWGMSRRDEALHEAKEGLALATSEGERRAAQQLIEFFEKHTSPPLSDD